MTSEPEGKASGRKTKKPIFIIQKHAASHLHYDFRLELGGVLLSWAVPKGPCLDPNIKRLAVHVEDHPLEYASFEGIIPKGQYGGGTVMLWDKGEWICDEVDPAAAYHKGHLSFILKAKKLKGRWKLFRINKDDKTWLLVKAEDEYAKPLEQYDILREQSNSVLTNKSIDEIAENHEQIENKKKKRKTTKPKINNNFFKKIITKFNLKPRPFPKKISPQLATLVKAPPEGKQWLHEIKFDGYRLLVFKHNGVTKLFTRHHLDWTNKFKSIAAEINKLAIETAIFDGEIVVLDSNQHSNFQLLQNAIKNHDDDFVFYLFDLIYLDKYDLTVLPLIERKKLLEKILDQHSLMLRYSNHVTGSGKAIFDKSCELGLEGIVSKDGQSLYLQKRNKNWLKIKCSKRQEFVIGGFTKPKGKGLYFGALLLGMYNPNNQLIYHGSVGTGFTQATLKLIYQALNELKTDTIPFNKRPPVKDVTWVKPELVCEVEFTEWTDDELLRHPSFKGLNNDKKAIMIHDAVTPTNLKSVKTAVHLTHADKVLYPEDNITKQEIAEYYQQIQKWILPYIVNRPLTLLRCPEGYQHCFYQKHINKATPSTLYNITVKEKGMDEDYMYIQDSDGLMTLPQMATLEIHSWGSRIEEIDYPDMVIFDLDPAPDVAWKKVVAAAFEIKKYLAEFNLKCFVKTTGGKGLHVVIPIRLEYDWADVKNFSRVFTEFLVIRNPDNYINKMSKEKRKGKIYIDYLRNQRGATAVSPYSTRAREHAPVATPIHWDELTNNSKDTFFTVKTLPLRLEKLKKDPWKDFFKLRQSLNLAKFK